MVVQSTRYGNQVADRFSHWTSDVLSSLNQSGTSVCSLFAIAVRNHKPVGSAIRINLKHIK